MKIQLLGPGEPSMNEDSTDVGRWREYVATYVLKHPTEWMPVNAQDKPKRGAVYLKR